MKSKQETFSILIVLISTLPYIHDLIDVGVKEGFLGFSDFRVFLFILLNHVFALFGWMLAFYLAKGRSWRFVLMIPLFSVSYEIILKILNLRSTSLNDLDVKFTLLIILSLIIIVWYFRKKTTYKNEPKK